MDDKDLFVVGAEFPELKFDGFLDWFIHFSDLKIFLKYQPSYLITQFAFIFGGLITLIHAIIRGGRLPYLWLGVTLHGLVVESLSYFIPDIDNFWHSQTPIILLGRRLPLHIFLLYACFIYQSSVGVAKARLPNWAEPFAVGLGVVLIDIPFDIIGVNFLHWTWHDTDPSIADRHYWAPWNSYYFHATFAASFTFWFHFTRKFLCKSDGKWLADKRISREILCTLIASLLGTPGGVLLFMPLYHPLHDLANIYSEVTFFLLFTIFLSIVWMGDRNARRDTLKHCTHWSTWLLIVHLLIHYSSFLIMAIFMHPENEIAMGIRERIGPCNEHVPVPTPVGLILSRRKYLCARDYDEKYFDWHCLPNGIPPTNGSLWYTVCGVPLPNRIEFIVIASILFYLGTVVYLNLHFHSSGDDVFNIKDTTTPPPPPTKTITITKRDKKKFKNQ